MNYMKKTLTTLAFALSGFAAFAQQDPQFTQNMYNRLFVNPGYTGMNSALCITSLYRQQWTGFDGAPTTGVLSVDYGNGSPWCNFGLNVMYDKLGFDKTVGARLTYAYHIPLGDGAYRLGIGLDVGMLNKQIGGAWVATTNWMQDGSIPPSLTKTTYDLGFGAYFRAEKLYFGISTTHLTAQDFNGGTSTTPDPTNPPNYTRVHNLLFAMARHYYVMAGYDVNLGSDDWKLRPSTLIKSDATITQFDLNLNVLFQNMIWAGATYRYQDAIAPTVGFQKTLSNNDWFKIGYSYDVTTSAIKSYSNGTHEIMLNYCHPINVVTHPQMHEDVRQGFF